MALEKITQVGGRGVYVPGDDLDTDRIIPARFMKCVTFDGLGEFAFYDVRFDKDGKKIALYHGTINELMTARISSGEYDVFVRGHSHMPEIKSTCFFLHIHI
jgi:3-isopropylmalate dehydratase small subunit